MGVTVKGAPGWGALLVPGLPGRLLAAPVGWRGGCVELGGWLASPAHCVYSAYGYQGYYGEDEAYYA